MTDITSIVISSRIRIARNFKGFKFPSRISDKDADKISNSVVSVLTKLGNYKIYSFKSLTSEDLELMFEKHLISKEAKNNKESGVAIIRGDEKVSVMVNEEDHLRAQCIMKGFSLQEAYATINDIDDAISKEMDYAFSDEFGYLTSCVTNVGTGLRASVMLFLPALSISGAIESIISAIKTKGLTIRGEVGEGSKPLGYIYQVSNAISMGITEKETISAVESAVKRIVELEKEERMKLAKDLETRDLCTRAFGIISCASLLSWQEFMIFAGRVKLGITLSFIKFKDELIIDKLIDRVSDAGIKKMFKKELSDSEVCERRAEYVSEILRNARVF